jgi:hypothetical protein
MTIRRETPPGAIERISKRYPKTAAWLIETAALVEGANRSAGQTDLNMLVTRVNRREMALSTVLNGVRFHAQEEYPHLLANEPAYAFLAIQGANLNDQHALNQFLAGEMPAALRLALEKLGEHLTKFTPEVGEV